MSAASPSAASITAHPISSSAARSARRSSRASWTSSTRGASLGIMRLGRGTGGAVGALEATKDAAATTGEWCLAGVPPAADASARKRASALSTSPCSYCSCASGAATLSSSSAIDVDPSSTRRMPDSQSGTMPARLACSCNSMRSAPRAMAERMSSETTRISGTTIRPRYPVLRHASHPTATRSFSVLRPESSRCWSSGRSATVVVRQHASQSRRMSRCAMTPLSAPESAPRSTPMSARRPIAEGASMVWSVESTRCPVSPAFTAIPAVSPSRISPMRMTSGSWRTMDRNAEAKPRPAFSFTCT